LRLEHVRDGANEALPSLALGCQPLQAAGRECVELRAPAFGRDAPRRGNQLLVLEPVQGRIERTLIDLQRLARQLADPFRDAPAVERLELQRLEDERVERAL